MPLAEAEKIGAEMEFGAKYPDVVSVYFIEDKEGSQFSKEFCGGPHISNTSELGHFKIQKEEAVSAGVRRIKAVLE
jgi:alanyl-tRNA synthetase